MKLRSIVGCQELIRMGVVKEGGEIPANYKASESMITPAIVDLEMSSTDSTSVTGQSTLSSTAADAADPSATARTATYSSPNKPANSDYFLWVVNRLSRRGMYENEHIPGYTAVRSATVKCNFHPTTTVLTPILPYPATTYDAVLTTMINFQDALKQKGDAYGGLWADEGVYCIAKEIQLLKPDKFGNIWISYGEDRVGLPWFIPRTLWNI